VESVDGNGELDGDDKYIVFKRKDFLEYTEPKAMNFLTAEMHNRGLQAMALADAVVIRRQDLFASPALATYASCIAITLRTGLENPVLRNVADYFQRQSELAAEEGYKLPD
jgi:hypothetical protein